MNIYVINLKHRVDRYQKIKQNFSIYKNINLVFIEAVKHENGAIGCFLSHKKCIQHAKDNQMKNIIVVEDDCLPIGYNFEERLINITSYLDNNTDWDIFLGGVNGTIPKYITKLIQSNNENLFEITFGGTAHFIIYNNTSYYYFLEQDETKTYVDKCWSNHLKALTCYPFIATQYCSYSDIEKMDVGYHYTRKFIKTEKVFEEYINNAKSV